jgi:hypothetical protein
MTLGETTPLFELGISIDHERLEGKNFWEVFEGSLAGLNA